MKGISKELDRARKYVKEAGKEKKQEATPVFHLKAPVGWMNDPNGFSFYQGEYHLFYQYHPYSNKWGPMHWGHAKTRNFVEWEHLPVALAPDQEYDCDGCFSGSAIWDDNKHILAYTSVYIEKADGQASKVHQTQSIAVGDGFDYYKQENGPAISGNMLPKNSSRENFRDPKIWKENDKYYIIVGNRSEDGKGQILKFSSRNLQDWNYEGVLYQASKKIGCMWECPDYFKLNGRQILIFSPQDMQAEGLEYHCGNGSLYFVGREAEGRFLEESGGSLDYGIDFYAPQTVLTEDGRRILIAWMQSWDANIYPPELKWCGMMTFPRELFLEDQIIRQLPAGEIEAFWENEKRYEDVFVEGQVNLPDIRGRALDLTLRLRNMNCSVLEIRLAKRGNHYISIEYDTVRGIFTFDRKFSYCIRDVVNERKILLEPQGGVITMRILLDFYSVELFLNNGEKTLTSTFFMEDGNDEIEFLSFGGSFQMDLLKHDIKAL